MEAIDLLNSVITFLSQTTLLRWLTVLLGSLTVTLTVLLFWIYLFLLVLAFVLELFSLHWKTDEVVVSVSIDFPSNWKGDAPFHCIACDCSHAEWGSLCDHLRDVSSDDIFKLSASAATSKFWDWVQVEIDAYIQHRKYHVNPHLFPWFSASCAAALVHRNHFFRLYQQNKFSESKVKFREASNF